MQLCNEKDHSFEMSRGSIQFLAINLIPPPSPPYQKSEAPPGMQYSEGVLLQIELRLSL